MIKLMLIELIQIYLMLAAIICLLGWAGFLMIALNSAWRNRHWMRAERNYNVNYYRMRGWKV
jgi:hypothetical protein